MNVEFAMVAKKGGALLQWMEVSYEEEVIISISSGVVCPYSEYCISFGWHFWKIGIGNGGDSQGEKN